jgi:L-threonylcarbamoyladenylate synthase
VIVSFDSESIQITTRMLNDGGVVIIPCDTIYGMCGAVMKTNRRISDLKGRDESKRLIVLAPNVDRANYLVKDDLDEQLTACWPAPLTIIAMGKDEETVAIRVPDDAFLLEVMANVGPIYSTSANRSGEPSLGRIADIVEQFSESVDLIVDAGDLINAVPSTIVDTTTRPYRILRDGCYTFPSHFISSGLIGTG